MEELDRLKELRLTREAVDCPSLEVLKATLDGALNSMIWWKVSLPRAGGGSEWALSSFPTQTSLGFHYFIQIYINLYSMLAWLLV